MLYLFQKKDVESALYSFLFWKLCHEIRSMKELPFLHVFSTIDLNVRESNSWHKNHVSNQSSWAEASMMTIKFLIQLFYFIMLVGLLLALLYLERVILKKGLTDIRLEWKWNWILIDCWFYLLLMGCLRRWCIICLDGANNFLLKSNGLLFTQLVFFFLSSFVKSQKPNSWCTLSIVVLCIMH